MNKKIKTKWGYPIEWEYVYISYSDISQFNQISELQIKWILQDLGYPLFGVIDIEPDYDVYHYTREDDPSNCRYKFGYKIKDFTNG